MVDKSKATVTMSLEDYESMQYDINFYKERVKELTSGKYVETSVIDQNGDENGNDEYFEVDFNLFEFLKDNYMYFNDRKNILEHIYSIEEIDQLTIKFLNKTILVKNGKVI